MGQDLIELNDIQHVKVHRYLKLLGWGYGDASRATWAKLSVCQQKLVIVESLRYANVSEGAITQAMAKAMACANAGVKTPRVGKCGKLIKCLGLAGLIATVCFSDDAEGAIVETFHPVNIVFGGCTTMGDAEIHLPPLGPEQVDPLWLHNVCRPRVPYWGPSSYPHFPPPPSLNKGTFSIGDDHGTE